MKGRGAALDKVCSLRDFGMSINMSEGPKRSYHGRYETSAEVFR